MFSYQSLPPPKTVLSAASDLFPTQYFKPLFNRLSAQLTLIVQDSDGLTPNQLFQAANLYLATKLSPSTLRIKVHKPEKEDQFTLTVDRNQQIVDVFQTVKCKWVLQTQQIEVSGRGGRESNGRSELRYFELSFHRKHKERVLKNYLPYVVKRAKEIKEETKAVKFHNGTDYWSSVALNHPATFETLGMDEEKKAELLEDLDLFLRRKEYYRRVGKAWKRGYLFYGPPGTGKSSLVAAMANRLKFDVYDLDLREVQCNSDLRRLLIGTKSRSILVIEDIDCNVGLQNRESPNSNGNGNDNDEDKRSLSGLLNFIDGLWSSCGDERIVVFTTNHKDRLDPALLRPGRMDVHLELSYCTFDGFKLLASTYLGVKDPEEKAEVFKDLLSKVEVTPAEVAGELMKGEDVEMVLTNFIQWLQRKEGSMV